MSTAYNPEKVRFSLPPHPAGQTNAYSSSTVLYYRQQQIPLRVVLIDVCKKITMTGGLGG